MHNSKITKGYNVFEVVARNSYKELMNAQKDQTKTGFPKIQQLSTKYFWPMDCKQSSENGQITGYNSFKIT